MEMNSSTKLKPTLGNRVTKDYYPKIAAMYVDTMIRLGKKEPTQEELERETVISQTKWSILLRDQEFLDLLNDAITNAEKMISSGRIRFSTE